MRWPSGLSELGLLQAIIDQMPVGVAIARMGTGELLLHNVEAVRLLGHPMLPSPTYHGYSRYGALRADGSPLRPEDYPIGRAALRGEVVAAEEMLYRRGDGQETTLLVSAAPIRRSDGEAEICVSTFQDIGRRKALEEALRAAHAQARNQAAGLMGLLQNMNEGIYILDPKGVLLHANQAASAMFGVGLSATSGRTVGNFLKDFRLLDDAGRPLEKDEWPSMRALRGERFENLELTVRRNDGNRVFIGSFNGTPIIDSDGNLAMVVISVRDVTERKRAERQRELLVAELAHRVKNTLATVQTVTRQTLADPDVPPAVRARLENRIVSLAHAHTLLAETRWAGALLERVAALQLAPYADHIDASGPPIKLGPRATVSIGMALHELATNAAKYGALSWPGGRVRLHWCLHEGGAERWVRMVWEEKGGPPVAPPQRRGFGLTLIERSVPYDLDGRVSLDFRPSGLYCEMVVPSHDPT
ncbi:HWE histidine kinase domain-containing protein [Novispirillum sp. DQ9]|uniref:HWE histidine kinase domain-containing protein n=1 Tax=Novispirillum sp. DQ9 TaxID=3398612 RepID=UPI003C798760